MTAINHTHPHCASPTHTADDEMSIPPRAPSRVGYRRPQLARTKSCRELFPDLAPIRTSTRLKSFDDSDSDDDDGSDEEGAKPLAVALPSLCPPSPISPTSSASSSESLDSPTSSSSEDLYDYEDEPGCDGFPPPPLPQSAYLPPPTPAPSHHATSTSSPSDTSPSAGSADDTDIQLDEPAPDAPPPLIHHGLSRAALQTCRQFWDHRFHLWRAWQAQVDRLDAVQAEYARDGLRATLRYPAPPVLPRSRGLPQSPNRREAEVRVEEQMGRRGEARLQTYNPYAPIFPRLGDLRALRDPYCDWPDRAFINFPTYSIAKILWLNDLLVREQERRRGALFWAGGVIMGVPESPASMYSEGCASPSEASTADAGSEGAEAGVSRAPPRDVQRPWEVDWRARWQVLIDRQPYPPQPYPPGSPLCYPPSPDQAAPAQDPPHSSYPPTTGPMHPIHGWSAPIFAPPPGHEVGEGAQTEEEERVFAWDATEDIPSLVPLASPLTKVELEAPRPGTPVRGWSDEGAEEREEREEDGESGRAEATPVVRLPSSRIGSGLKRAGASTDLSALPSTAASPEPSARPFRPPLYRTTLAHELAAAAAVDSHSSEDDETPTSSAAFGDEIPPRPASPAPRFYFYEDEEEDFVESSFGKAVTVRGSGPGLEAIVSMSVSVQPVSC
ncbi:hypothetical protein OH77DRAFT_1427494 [Trametes cingulata]|nr:hypothetical protein OH77DRAFT_1427494 [Trametes cingulata]